MFGLVVVLSFTSADVTLQQTLNTFGSFASPGNLFRTHFLKLMALTPGNRQSSFLGVVTLHKMCTIVCHNYGCDLTRTSA